MRRLKPLVEPYAATLRDGRDLYGLLIAVEDRLGSERAREAQHLIEVDEYDLALEEIAGVLGLAKPRSTDQ